MKSSKLKAGIAFMCINSMFLPTLSIAAHDFDKKNSKIYKKYDNNVSILKDEEAETLNLINQYREKNGLNDLKVSSELQDVAKLKAEDLVNNNYFSHNSENLGTPFEMMKDNNVYYKVAGENLAGNTTPEKAVDAWINSDSHRDNILEDRYEYTGIYVIDSEEYGKVFVQLFTGLN